MKKYFAELILIVISLLPYAYLWLIWEQLPDTVPTHFNFQGQADDWSSKSTLLYLPGLLGIGIYLLMLILPSLDPKNKLRDMGQKFFTIRLILALFMTALSLYILYASWDGRMNGPNFIMLIMGAFFAALGNYLQAVRPNYFVGIRTPWTLENEEVWKSTHRLGGKIWMIGGLMILLLALIRNHTVLISILFGVIMTIMVLVPVIHSYRKFRQLRQSNQLPGGE